MHPLITAIVEREKIYAMLPHAKSQLLINLWNDDIVKLNMLIMELTHG